MAKSNDTARRYRPGASRGRQSLVSFRAQMADYAKGDVLLMLRTRKRMSREAVAAELGVTTKTVYAWEKQNGGIRWEHARKLGSFYDVEPESLVTRDPDEAAGVPSREQLDRIEETLTQLAEQSTVDPSAPATLGERFDALRREVTEQLAEHARRVEGLLERQDAILKRIEAAVAMEEAAAKRLSDDDEWVRRIGEMTRLALAGGLETPERGSQKRAKSATR